MTKNAKDDSKPRTGLFDSQLGHLFENLMDVSSLAVKYAAKSTSNSTAALLRAPEQLELMGKAGSALKDLRVTAGYSLEELATLLDIENPSVLKSIEEGNAALPMNIMLRMSSLYSRNDPIPFIMRFSRTYHPSLSNMLSVSGLDKIMIQAERELKLVNIYRAQDTARQLSDEDFDQVLTFTKQAFDMALHFVSDNPQQSSGDQEPPKQQDNFTTDDKDHKE